MRVGEGEMDGSFEALDRWGLLCGGDLVTLGGSKRHQLKRKSKKKMKCVGILSN